MRLFLNHLVNVKIKVVVAHIIFLSLEANKKMKKKSFLEELNVYNNNIERSKIDENNIINE